MTRGGFKIEGLKGLEEALVELEQMTGKINTGRNAVQRGLIKAMRRIEDRARQLAPVDDGDLRNSITTKKARAKRTSRDRFARETGVEIHTGPAGKGSGFAYFNEFGTINAPPHPFMRPAADSESEAVVAEVAKVLREEIDKTVARAKKRAASKK
jgi:HK97 gp10 family phage protein